MKLLPPPGRARTQQLLLLGVVLVGGAYAVSRLGTSTPASPAIPASNTQTRPTTAVADSSRTLPQPLLLDRLEPVEDAPVTTRNPFSFGSRPVPPAPVPAYVPPPPPPRPAAPPAAVVPPIPLRFVGRLVMPDKRVVVSLSDGRGGIVQGMEGQIIDGRYRLVRVGEESLVIEYLDGTGRTTLALRGS